MRRLCPILLALALAGCAGAEAPDPCPQIGLMSGLDRIDLPAGAAAASVVQRGVLELRAASCSYEAGAAIVDISLDVAAEPGPAFVPTPARLTYFAAVLAPDETVLDKRLFTSEVTLAAGQPRAGFGETLRLRLPGVGAAEGPRHRILLGFQLEDGPAAPPPVPEG